MAHYRVKTETAPTPGLAPLAVPMPEWPPNSAVAVAQPYPSLAQRSRAAAEPPLESTPEQTPSHAPRAHAARRYATAARALLMRACGRCSRKTCRPTPTSDRVDEGPTKHARVIESVMRSCRGAQCTTAPVEGKGRGCAQHRWRAARGDLGVNQRDACPPTVAEGERDMWPPRMAASVGGSARWLTTRLAAARQHTRHRDDIPLDIAPTRTCTGTFSRRPADNTCCRPPTRPPSLTTPSPVGAGTR